MVRTGRPHMKSPTFFGFALITQKRFVSFGLLVSGLSDGEARRFLLVRPQNSSFSVTSLLFFNHTRRCRSDVEKQKNSKGNVTGNWNFGVFHKATPREKYFLFLDHFPSPFFYLKETKWPNKRWWRSRKRKYSWAAAGLFSFPTSFFPLAFFSFQKGKRKAKGKRKVWEKKKDGRRMAMGKLERRIQKLMKATLGRLDSS